MGDGYLNFFLIVLKRQLFYVDGDRRFEYHCLLIVILIAIVVVVMLSRGQLGPQ